MARLFSDQLAMLELQCPEGTGTKAASLQRLAVAAVYRNLPLLHPWTYYRRRKQVVTNAPYGEGTIAYDATTLAVTLSGGTWPTWAASGSIIINSKVYKVDTRDSGTQLTLSSTRSPAIDVDAGTGYQLYQSEYALPADFSRMEQVVEIGSAWVLEYIPPEQMLDWAYTLFSPTRPWRFTISGAQYGPIGRMNIEFIPPPASSQTFDILYEAKPRARTLQTEATAGTVSISGSTVTGVGTTFTSAMVGCVLRTGTTTKLPTDSFGQAPFVGEYTIRSVASATSLTINETGASEASVKYLIDDYIDVDMNMCLSYFEAACLAEYMSMATMKGAIERRQLAMQLLLEAKGADHRINLHDVTPTSSLSLYATAVAPHFAPRG